MQTSTLAVPGASITYDVRGQLPTSDGAPPLLLIGQPMTADGFVSLAANTQDRTVVTYDPRGLGRSQRTDGRTEHDPRQQADDLHALITELGGGPVDVFGSSGGAIAGLALVERHPQDVRTLVAHEPPLLPLLPDAGAALKASAAVTSTYHRAGWGAGMAHFIAMVSWQGEFPDDWADRPAPDPAMFGMPTEDDGRRDDPLLSGVSDGVSGYVPDIEALRAAPARIVIGVGEETGGAMTARTSTATAEALGSDVVLFPGDHGGFLGGEFGQHGKPEAFAVRLREVLAGS